MHNKNILEYFVHAITKNYVNFSGRSRRKEFWSIILFFFLSIILTSKLSDFLDYEVFGYLFGGIFAFFFLPILSGAVRRMHDIGKSGTNLLIYFIPIIGGIWVLVLLMTESDYGTNRYGYNPKKDNSDNEIEAIGKE